MDDLVRVLPGSARVGLTVYGTGTGSSASDKPAGCRDISVLVPVGPLDRSRIEHAVSSVRARGYTPIGAALTKAAAALPKNRPASIVLVSDGEETCAPPAPCAVAAVLKKANADLVVHTIGFRVDPTARSQLSCIARVTGGTYRDAADGARLGPQLQGEVDAGLRPYLVEGTPIDGTAAPEEAPDIGRGQYADTFAAGGPTTKYYALQLRAPQTLYVATTIIPPALRGGGVTSGLTIMLRLLGPGGHRCLSTERESNALLAGKVDPVTALIAAAVGGPGWSRRCPREGRFVLQVTRDSVATTSTRSETIVRVEPPVAGSPPPAVAAVPPGLPMPPASARSANCTGGTSFNDAPVVGQTTCSDSLATGETRYYRVHLAWGQRLTYRIVIDRVSGAGHGSGEVRSAIATPLRQLVTLASTSNASRGFGGPSSITVSGSTLVPVEYGNRFSPRSDIRPYDLAGDYYLSLGMSYPVNALPYRTGVHLTVRTAGTAQAGPRYLAEPIAAPPSSAQSTPGVQVSSNPPSGIRSAEAAATASSSSGSGSRDWLVGGGLAVVIAAGAGFVVQRQRRQR